MQYTTTCSRGDVVLVPYPFTDLTGSRQRPGVVVSSDTYNQATNDLMIAQITGNVTSPERSGDHMIVLWQQARLHMPSRVRAKIATFNHRVVRRVLGQLSQVDMMAVEANLQIALQLP